MLARVQPLGDTLRLVLIEVRIDDVGQVVDRRPALLLRHAPVVRPHAPFDVDEWEVLLRHSEAPHHRVGIAEEDDGVGHEVFEDWKQPGDDLGGDLGVGRSAGAQLQFRRRHVELTEEDVLEVVGVALTPPDECHVDVIPGFGAVVEHEACADDVGTDPEDDG